MGRWKERMTQRPFSGPSSAFNASSCIIAFTRPTRITRRAIATPAYPYVVSALRALNSKTFMMISALLDEFQEAITKSYQPPPPSETLLFPLFVNPSF